MGKSKRSDREFTKEQRLTHENQQLKRQVSALRKELARVDLDRYKNLKETINEHYQEDRAQEGLDMLEKIKNEWKCHSCEAGFLEIFLYNKLDSTWYFRRCNCCPNRTKSQRYDSGKVRGIIKKAAEPQPK